MLRATWRALSSLRAQAAAQSPGSALRSGGSASLPSARCGLQPPSLLHAARAYAVGKPDLGSKKNGAWEKELTLFHIPFLYLTAQHSQDDEPPPSTLIKEYKSIIPSMEKVDDVVKRILSLEMADQKEKLKIKQEQLMSKIAENPEDSRTLEARVVALTVRIRNYEEHMQKHRKDKAHKRHLLMSIDQRNKMLKLLRQTNYDVFERTCKELGVEYVLPPLHFHKVHRRFLAKKALCIRVFQEVQKLKKQKRDLKAAAMAAKKQNKQRVPENPSQAVPEMTKEN
ncbi:28S ribosomal protein S15, mitochondrial isoform X1 [Cricetulus griseus]|uniref:Small ribosomal subunit protein uS15m n=1 Tax=Cricetulus griseus TaxID=10029 RepID=A0A9J7GMX5_CRIGR|nr:28S ribosomal protein S15, mitochondrial isoform X1 [Cricetulus griseus]XP_035310758.1 28S ribosomal protein S15, mitochondrial isoform X1 [Cricetulus griseus]ERE85659.1 28S ribosomal protein S15 [Cricetulus griseus]